MKSLTGRLIERVKAWVMRNTWDDVRTDFIEMRIATADPPARDPSRGEQGPISYMTFYAQLIRGRR